MPGLLELGPMTADIEVMGHLLTVHPLSVDDVIGLFSEFPELINLLADDSAERAAALAKVGPLAIAKVIACSTGDLHKPGGVEAAQRLSLGKTTEIIDKI